MSRSAWRKPLAITSTIVAFGLFTAAVILLFVTPAGEGGDAWGNGTPLGAVITFSPLLAFSVVGGLITMRRPENLIGWICLASGIGWSLIFFEDAYSRYGLLAFGREDMPVADWMFLFSWSIPAGLLATFLLLYFPNGRLPSERWRIVAVLSGVMIVVVSFNTGFVPDEGEPPPEIPAIVESLRPVAKMFDPAILLFPLCLLLCAASLVVRYRNANIDDRQRLKWISFAAAIVAGIYTLAFVGSFTAGWDVENTPPLWSAIQTISLMSFGLIPTAVGFAVLRYRLYDIDRIISRTLSYAVVTVVLVGMYLLVVLLSATVLGSGGSRPDWVVAVATLVAAFLFTPVRRRVQGAVDRRFNRRRYDAARTVEEFTSRLRSRVDLDDVSASLGQVVRSTLAPSNVWVWTPTRGTEDSRGRQRQA